jgi:PAS domain S-box-containing protein
MHAVVPVIGFSPLVLLVAVALSGAYGGVGPGLVSILICTGTTYYIEAVPGPVRTSMIVRMILFVVVAIAVVLLMELRRRQNRRVSARLLEFSTLLDSMPEAVFIVDPHGIIADVNSAAETLCARHRDELIDLRYDSIGTMFEVKSDNVPLSPEDSAVARALRGERVPYEERTFTSATDGTTLNVVVSATPMMTRSGRIAGAMLLVRDITQLSQLRRNIEDAERHLAIGQMATGIAHDFNNVLQTIAQAAALLQYRPEAPLEERKNYVAMIDNATRNGSDIIRRVREYIRGGTGERMPLNIASVLHESLDLTKPMWRGLNNLVVTTDLKCRGEVVGNAADLRRVFTNLIINAIQAMPQGGRLTVGCNELDGVVYATVSDTGQGIPPEQQKKIFLPYFTTKTGGTGLGLSTAQKIVLAQSGKIEFSTEPGTGTTFTVQLPALAVCESAQAA